MDFPTKPAAALFVSALLVLASSCARLEIGPPAPDRQTILVLPVQVTNKTQYSKHGFYYIYEIAELESDDIVEKAVFKLPLDGDMLIIDTLPPGSYYVDKFIFKPLGSGDFTYGNNVESRRDRFDLEAGKITIFSQSLNVLLYNRTAGRGAETTYNFKMARVSKSQLREILVTLGELPHFDAWEVHGFK